MRKYHKMIEDIKDLSSQQCGLKAQRKTVHLKVDRIMPAFEATLLTAENSRKLMHLFIAYAQLRCKEPQLPLSGVWDRDLVKNLVDKYQVTETI